MFLLSLLQIYLIEENQQPHRFYRTNKGHLEPDTSTLTWLFKLDASKSLLGKMFVSKFKPCPSVKKPGCSGVPGRKKVRRNLSLLAVDPSPTCHQLWQRRIGNNGVNYWLPTKGNATNIWKKPEEDQVHKVLAYAPEKKGWPGMAWKTILLRGFRSLFQGLFAVKLQGSNPRMGASTITTSPPPPVRRVS